MEAAQAARKPLHAKRSGNHGCQARGGREPEVTECVAVVATHLLEDHLVEAVAATWQLLAQMMSNGNQERTSESTTDPPSNMLAVWTAGPYLT